MKSNKTYFFITIFSLRSLRKASCSGYPAHKSELLKNEIELYFESTQLMTFYIYFDLTCYVCTFFFPALTWYK